SSPTLLFHDTADHRHLHSFPTRRSSDLLIELAENTIALLDRDEKLRVVGAEGLERRFRVLLELIEQPLGGFHMKRDRALAGGGQDRKSTRLNSSHRTISYAVFCLKKKND